MSEVSEANASEVNVFSIDPQGYKCHIKIVAGTTGAQLNELLKRQQQLSEWLTQSEFKPDDMGRSSGGGGKAAPTTTKTRLAAPPCSYCGGEVWDNRDNKRNPKGPDFKCKDKECGAAAWVDKDGGIKWSDPL